MGSTKSKTTSSGTQTVAPPTWTAPGLSDAAAHVTAGISQIPTDHYAGPMVATMDPAQLAAIQAQYGATASNAQGLSSWLQGQLPTLSQGQSFTTALPSTDYTLAPKQDLNAVINASINPVFRQLTEQILPGLHSSSLDAGAYSGDRAMSVLPENAIRDSNASAQNIAAQLGYEDYQNYENRRLAAYNATTGAAQQNYMLDTQRQQETAADSLARLGLAPDIINSILHTQASSADLMKMAADLGMTNTQAGYNNAIGMDQYASQAPFMGLDTASQLLAQLSGNYGTTNTNQTSTQTQSQPLAGQLIQGALGVGSMIGGFPMAGGASVGGNLASKLFGG